MPSYLNYNSVYLTDLDRTLFDTARFIKDLNKALRKAGIFKSGYEHEAAEYLLTNRPGTIFDFLRSKGEDEQRAESIVEELLSQNDYLFEDASLYLEKRKQNNGKVIIFSFGVKEFQLKKINTTPLLSEYKSIILTEDKGAYLAKNLIMDETSCILKSLKIKSRRFIYIDDNPRFFIQAPQLECLQLVHLNRSGAKYSSNGLKFDEVRSLTEV